MINKKKKKKEIYDIFLEFIDCENDDDDENEKFNNFINLLNKRKILENYDEIFEFLILINKISKYHNRHLNFISRIEQTITYFEEIIKQNFTNFQIFNIFRHNMRILLFLFDKKIITVDQDILRIFQIGAQNYKTYRFYFYDKIKDQISIQDKKNIEGRLLKDPNIFNTFKEKVQKGENDSYICSLIREDSIEEFVSHISRLNISINSKIKPSIFETNYFLLTHTPSLIEYAAFHGSIQIFQNLRLNGADLNPSLWLYAIHGKNPEIIHLIEENHLKIEYNEILNESIKCHHNDIADYFENNYFENTNEKTNPIKKIFNFIKNKIPNIPIENKDDAQIKEKIGFRYHNLRFIPDDFNNAFLFKYFCEFNYLTFCNLFIKNKVVKVNDKFVNTITFFYKEIYKKKVVFMEFSAINIFNDISKKMII